MHRLMCVSRSANVFHCFSCLCTVVFVCLVVVAVSIIICQALNLVEPSMFHLELR